MQELYAKANQAILRAQCLRRERRALRIEALERVHELGQTALRARHVERESAGLKMRLDQAFSKARGSLPASGVKCP